MQDLVCEALALPHAAMPYHVSRGLAARYPGRFVMESEDSDFDLEAFACDGLCEIRTCPDVTLQTLFVWHGPEAGSARPIAIGAFEVAWRGHAMPAVKLTWPDGGCASTRWWIVAPDEPSGSEFFDAVARWNSEVRGELLVFHGGGWFKDEDLYRAVRDARLDDVVLAGGLVQTILSDFEQFFASRDMYALYGIPWKRGALFLGPPGNGKTHTLKALVHALDRPCLYVKSFREVYGNEHESVRRVFERARRTAPCLLILEDLDSLLHDGNRSFFLNELDGFADNTGVVVLATTNYPERLDPAILERPSRFDRKYHFDLPARPERVAYILKWNERLTPETRLSPAGVESVADHTDGFSFAYLKELFLSSLMAWIGESAHGAMDAVMLAQAESLERQRKSGSAATPAPDHGEHGPVAFPMPPYGRFEE
jgi:hypothetical protein